MNVLVGGVGELYQGDLDLGRIAIEHLRSEDLGQGVAVEDLYYGAIAVAQHLEELRPDALVLIGAAQRDRAPGTVERRRVLDLGLVPAQVQVAVADAVTGYVSLDLLLEVASGLDVLPGRTVVIDVEPARLGPVEQLSPSAEAALSKALELVRAEVRRIPLLSVAESVRDQLAEESLEPSPALEAMRDLLGELELLDAEGRWGATFALRDRVRSRIAAGETSEGMSHLDWVLWWGLIEELDRLQSLEGVMGPA